MLWWLSPGEELDAVIIYEVVINCNKAQLLKIKALVSSICAKGCVLADCVCYMVLDDYPSLVGGESHGILLKL